jgi:hypothetical protein
MLTFGSAAHFQKKSRVVLAVEKCDRCCKALYLADINID